MNGRSSFSSHDIIVGLWRLASWKLDGRRLASWTRNVLELGIDAFDLADVYGEYSCEQLFGDALRADPGLRDELRIISKCNIKLVSERRPAHTRHAYDSSREHIIASVEESLRALGTDCLDVMLLHRQDPLMDPSEVAAAFEQLQRDGKVLAFGVSNFTPTHLAMLASYLSQPLVTHQVEASVLHLDPFEDGSLDQCLEQRLRPMAWSPLGGGRLFTDKGERAQRVREAMTPIAATHDVELDSIAVAFLLRHPAGIHPLTGSGRLERIEAAVRACELELSREQWFNIWCASTGAPLP